MMLPYDDELTTPESLLALIGQEDVSLDIREIDDYPRRPLVFSEYFLDPPTIVVYRYLPAEKWMNLLCQQTVNYYGNWYYLHIAYRFYYYLEINDLYTVKGKWYHWLFGGLETLDERAYYFTQHILGTLHSPRKFDEAVERSYYPDAGRK